MVKIDSHPIHAISWIDLAARDLPASVEFYAGLFGWNAVNDDGHPYTIFQAGTAAVAGAMELTPEMGEMPPVWSAYVNVVDADATCAAATAAGGAVMQPPFDISDGGRIAVIADPAGAVICLFEGGSDGTKVMDEVGGPCWFDCLSRDVAASTAFYADVFGWTSQVMDMGDTAYTIFSNDGQPVAGTMDMPPMIPAQVPSYWQVNIVVADADEAAAHVIAKGGTVPMPPMDTPFGRACVMVDPWGATLSLIDRSTATATV